MNTKHTAFKPVVLSLLVSGLMYSAATQHATASDLQIYKPPEGGKATVVLMLDTSGSMSAVAMRQLVLRNDSNRATYEQWLAEACDLPGNGRNITLPPIASSGTSPSYDRVICQLPPVTVTNVVYRQERSRSRPNIFTAWTYTDRWFGCQPNTTTGSVTACSSPLSPPPSVAGLTPSANWSDTTTSTRYFSRSTTTTQTNPDRITRLKDALFETLDKKDTEGNYVLGEKVLMGLGQYSSNTGQGGDNDTGRMIVPALAVTPEHRTTLLNTIAGLFSGGGTPTAHAYAEAAAYLMGTTTGGGAYSGFAKSSNSTKVTDLTKYQAPFQTTANAATCDGQGIYVLTDGVPTATNDAPTVMNAALGTSPALGTASTPALSGSSGWADTGEFAKRLFNKDKNPAKFKILTAVVGFGSTFDDPNKGATLRTVGGKTYYDCSTITSSTDAKNACNWGAKSLYLKGTTYAVANKDGSIPEGYAATDLVSGGYGQGGFYPATNTADVVQSILDFVSDIKPEIDPVPTGSIIIPQDTLAPDSLQRYAYVPALLTQPSDPVVVWRGNLKKYKVDKGTIYGKYGTNQLVFDSSGGFSKTTSDFWGSSTVADLGNVQTGGMFDKIPYKTTKEGSVERSVWVQKSGTTLTKVEATKESVDGLELGNYASRKILNFMGYSLSGLETDVVPPTSDIKAPDTALRSLGGVVHSTPQLLTYGAEYDDNGQLKADRDDYLLFGSMEGSLHLVDAGTGIERFVFLPKTIIEKQPRALLEGTEGSLDSSGGLRSKTGSPPMYYPAYGVDAPWAAYAEYARAAGSATASSKITASKMYAYGGLRMGGAGFYGMNLTNKDNPSLMFAIEDGAAGFDRLGQTWGKPVITRIRYKNKPHLVVVISGGYDPQYESPTFKSGSATAVKGNAVYIVSAETANTVSAGTLLYTIDSSSNSDMKHSIVGRVKTLDRDADGLTDHLYFADLGGQVFRSDIDNVVTTAAPNATIRRTERLANLSNPDGSLPRFYEAPTVTIHDEDGKRFAVVNVASGDRSNPLYGEATDTSVGPAGLTPNRVYGLIDRDVTRVDLYTLGALTMSSSGTVIGDLMSKPTDFAAARTAMLSDTASARKKGWYVDLVRYGSVTSGIKGLKAFNEMAAIRNDLYVSVYNPNATDATVDKCKARVVGASELHRYCLPFGVCPASTVTGQDNDIVFNMGKGIQSVNIGPGEKDDTRRIIYQKPTTEVKNEVTGSLDQNNEYQTPPRLVPIRWYEKQPKLNP